MIKKLYFLKYYINVIYINYTSCRHQLSQVPKKAIFNFYQIKKILPFRRAIIILLVFVVLPACCCLPVPIFDFNYKQTISDCSWFIYKDKVWVMGGIIRVIYVNIGNSNFLEIPGIMKVLKYRTIKYFQIQILLLYLK